MLTSGNDLQTLNIGEMARRMADVEQVHAFFQEKSQDRKSAEDSVRRLQVRLELLREKTAALGSVELSEHVLSILEHS